METGNIYTHKEHTYLWRPNEGRFVIKTPNDNLVFQLYYAQLGKLLINDMQYIHCNDDGIMIRVEKNRMMFIEF